MASTNLAPPPPPLELRAKRWTAVAVVCFLGLLAALPFRSAPHSLPPTVASSHRERSLRFRAEAPDPLPYPSAAPESIKPISGPPSTRSEPLGPTTSPELAHPVVTDEINEGVQSTSDLESLNKSLEPDPTWRAKEPISRKAPLEKCVARHGENLMDIADRVLGDRKRWKELVELNPQFRSGFDEVGEGEEIIIEGGTHLP